MRCGKCDRDQDALHESASVFIATQQERRRPTTENVGDHGQREVVTTMLCAPCFAVLMDTALIVAKGE